MKQHSAFTLVEVLISILLISLVLLGLYKSLNIQRQSNRNLQRYLQKATEQDRAVMVLYRDLLASDGNLSIAQGNFDRLCISNTTHSFYGLANPKVCWVVLKDGNKLVRTEGGDYRLPLGIDDRVVVDQVMGPMELFDITRKGDQLLVALKVAGKKPYLFLMQGIDQPKRIKPAKKKKAPAKKPKTKAKGGLRDEK